MGSDGGNDRQRKETLGSADLADPTGETQGGLFGADTDPTLTGDGPIPARPATPVAVTPVPITREDLPEAASLPDRFEVRGLLGRGGMGLVVEVHDRHLGRDVAVKFLPRERWSDASFRSRFLREAQAAGTLKHPGIVGVHDVDAENGFIVMELVRGESLSLRLKRLGRLPVEEVRRIGGQLIDALDAAHGRGIVHRDVKPGNILIDEAGRVRLADFGIASFGDSDLTSTGVGVGTPAYMAPEQLRGRSNDLRVDVYAAGATLFEAATGRRVHDETTTSFRSRCAS